MLGQHQSWSCYRRCWCGSSSQWRLNLRQHRGRQQWCWRDCPEMNSVDRLSWFKHSSPESMTLECQGWYRQWWWDWWWAKMLLWHDQAIDHGCHLRMESLHLLVQFFQAEMWPQLRPRTKLLCLLCRGVYDEVCTMIFNLPAHWVWRGHEWKWDLCNLDPCCYKCPLSLSVRQCQPPSEEESQKANCWALICANIG